MKKLLMTSLFTATALTAGTTGDALAQSKNLNSFEDGSNITLVGTVTQLTDDEFILNSNGNMVEVEVDDWSLTDNLDLTEHLKDGQEVIVYGTVDNDLFSDDEIEAASIFIPEQNNYIYYVETAPLYSQNFGNTTQAANNQQNQMDNNAMISAQGEIKSVDGNEAVIATSAGEMTVDMSAVSNRRGMDLQKGDQIFVMGNVDENLFSNKEIAAERLVKLTDARQSAAAAAQNAQEPAAGTDNSTRARAGSN
jgi:uncharacterized protein YdeI (BOF family)